MYVCTNVHMQGVQYLLISQQHSLLKDVPEGSLDPALCQGALGGAEAAHHAAQEVQQGGRDLGVCPQGVVHQEDSRLWREMGGRMKSIARGCLWSNHQAIGGHNTWAPGKYSHKWLPRFAGHALPTLKNSLVSLL